MPYIYHTSFNIDQKELGQLSVGKSLQLSLGYLKALLPTEEGYITSRAMYSISDPNKMHVILESVWDTWDDLLSHRDHSRLDEAQLLRHFDLQVELRDLESSIYEEVA